MMPSEFWASTPHQTYAFVKARLDHDRRRDGLLAFHMAIFNATTKAKQAKDKLKKLLDSVIGPQRKRRQTPAEMLAVVKRLPGFRKSEG